MKCPCCHKKIKKGSSVCDQCGAPVPESSSSKKCSCGASLREGAIFCNQCGKPVKKPHPWRKMVAVLLTVAILFGGVGVLGWQLGWFSWIGGAVTGSNEEEEVVEAYLNSAEATLNSDVAYFTGEETAQLEASILASSMIGDTLVLETSPGSVLDSLDDGDIFLLQGGADSGFGENYFGKIVNKYQGWDNMVYYIDTPAVDEVFDDFDLDFMQILNSGNMTDFYSVDGVTLENSGAATADAGEGAVTQVGSLSAGGITQLSATAEPTDVTIGKEGDNTFSVKIEIDILKLLQEKFKDNIEDVASDTSKYSERVSSTKAGSYTVRSTDTGVCYHKDYSDEDDKCRYLWNSDNKISLKNAVDSGLRPCSVCQPAVIGEDSDKDFADAELKLTGTVKLQDLAFGVYANGKEWTQKSGYENMSVKTTGDLVASVNLEGNLTLEFEQDDTQLIVNGPFGNPLMTLTGLKEKLLPIAYLTWNCGTFRITDVPGSENKLDTALSVGILLYTDLQGNISFGMEFNCQYTKPIDFEFDIFKDGKFLGVGAEDDKVNDETKTAGTLDWSFKAEIDADVDFQALGASMMLYVSNVNIFELSLARIGADVDGAIGFDSKKVSDENYGFYAEGKVRVYLQMLEINLKCEADILGADLEVGCTAGPLVDLTLWQLRKQTERDVVLVLDVSGSMSGTPITEAKNAALEFVKTVLEEDTSVAIVTYDSYSNVVSEFSSNEAGLTTAIENIYSGGSTNIEAGLLAAEELLEESQAKKKSIVLLSDGLPNEGKTDSQLIEYSNTIKDQDVYIYTLGFFEDLDSSSKVEAQGLMEALASDGMHYEVTSADDLVFFFGDLADQISGQKYIYIRIACPVDVTVKYDGERLCSKEDKLSTRTEFGTLTFEENDEEAEDEGSDNRIKILRLKEGTEYEIEIEGNGRGRMDYTIGFMDENGEYSDLREFRNIKITKRTEITTVAAPSEATYLYVDEDGDGKRDLTYKAAADSRAELVEESNVTMIVIVIVVVAVLAGGTATLIVLLVRRSKRKKRAIRV
ncbi:MAG: VWA domain-containing protein [Clostridia bacterium]|nr:VWA domain-containing protein [Clostridia bacterium]